MAKIYKASVVVMGAFILLVMLIQVPCFAASKYDFIKTHPEIPGDMEVLDTLSKNKPVIMEYLNLLVNERNVVQLAKSGKLDKEKSAFIQNNSKLFHKLIQVKFLVVMNEMSKDEQWKNSFTDRHFMLVNGIIKDPKALVAKNGVEYELEKTYLRGMPLYALWEKREEFWESNAIDIFDGFSKIKKSK